MKRAIWTVSLAFVGLVLSLKVSGPFEEMSLKDAGEFFFGPGLGALVGFGFGSIFSTKREGIMSFRERLASGLVGGALLLAALGLIHNLGRQAYYDYYLFPKIKDSYIPPTPC